MLSTWRGFSQKYKKLPDRELLKALQGGYYSPELIQIIIMIGLVFLLPLLAANWDRLEERCFFIGIEENNS